MRLRSFLGSVAGNRGRRHRRRRGAMLMLIVLLMFFFLGAVAFCVDVAYMQLSRTQLRIATDAAARASGEALSRSQSVDTARAAAKTIAAEHLVAGKSLVLDDTDILAGEVTRQTDGSWSFSESSANVNGLRIAGRRTKDSPSGSISLFFGKIFSVFDFEPSHHAVVVRLDRDICLVVDRSSSMKLYVTDTASGMSSSDARFCLPPRGVNDDTEPTSRWAALVDAVDVFTATLQATTPVEHVALVSYGSNGTWCGVQNNATDIDQALTHDVSQITSAMGTISGRVFNGGTRIGEGIDKGIDVLTDAATARQFAGKTLVVMTDGHQTSGRSPITAATDAAAERITVHTITFGSGANETQMKAVAAAGDGKHYHAADEAALQDAFRQIALTLPVLLTE